VVGVARRSGRLLAVDLSYRFTAAMRRIREIVAAGQIGEVYASDLVFHNAYGPDKEWFYDVSRSGGGCVMDLGIHLVDLALWTQGFPAVEQVTSRLFAGGQPLSGRPDVVEDFGIARLDLATGGTVQVACSWNLPAGCEAQIEATFYGTAGGVRMRNVNGSFYDFVAERFHGTTTEVLESPPDEWGGRAAVDWAERLARGEGFDSDAERLVQVAAVIDRIYGR
jgi:predicted dehydrogenase